MIHIEINPPPCPECQHFACVCEIVRQHVGGCLFRVAAAGTVGIECEHGRSVCPRCDPCTCPGWGCSE